MFAEKQLRTEQEQLMTLTLEMFTVFSKFSNIFSWQNFSGFPQTAPPWCWSPQAWSPCTSHSCWACTGWWTATTTAQSTSRTWAKTTSTTGHIDNIQIESKLLIYHNSYKIILLKCDCSSGSASWLVGCLVGHRYCWLRNNSVSAAGAR